MERTVTVRGTGKLSAKPDLIEISLTLRAKSKDYEEAMLSSSKQQEKLRAALESIGFHREELKTSGFNVRTEYDSERDRNGVYRQVFSGYVCEHMLSLRFGFDNARLSETLTALSACLAEPELYVGFTVKDRDALADALLAEAARSARKRAALLAEGVGMKLGGIVSIDHSRGEHDFYSPTRLNSNAKPMMKAERAMDLSVTPENVELSEEATFVWELTE